MAIWYVAPLRFAPAFRALGVCEHIWLRYRNFECSNLIGRNQFIPLRHIMVAKLIRVRRIECSTNWTVPRLHYHSSKYWISENTRYWNFEHDSLVGSANSRGRIGTLIKPKLAWVFVCFHSLLLAFLLKLLARSSKIVHILGALDKNLTRFLLRVSRK